MVDYKKQGKKNRINGAAFEREVRKDLEKKGFIVCKWSNNIEFQKENSLDTIGITDGIEAIYGKCVAAKHKFNPFKKIMATGTGFPDFICYKKIKDDGLIYEEINHPGFYITFIECKSNGRLTKEEKLKIKFYKAADFCTKFFIAKKGDGIEYVEQ